MKYLKIGKYIVTLESVHGVLHNVFTSTDISLRDVKIKEKGQIIITYSNGISASLDFDNKEDSIEAFQKIADALEAN